MKIVYRHLYWKDENKEKEDGNIPFFKKTVNCIQSQITEHFPHTFYPNLVRSKLNQTESIPAAAGAALWASGQNRLNASNFNGLDLVRSSLT